MPRAFWIIVTLASLVAGTAQSARAEHGQREQGQSEQGQAEPGERSWIRSFTKAYRDPANYPGRSVYAGSRYGFSGYARPVAGTDPYPRSMRKVVPPTMYFWSKSSRDNIQAPAHANGVPAFEAPPMEAYAD